MKCTSCGAELRGKFCTECGAKAPEPEQAAAVPAEPIDPPAIPDQPEVTPAPVQPEPVIVPVIQEQPQAVSTPVQPEPVPQVPYEVPQPQIQQTPVVVPAQTTFNPNQTPVQPGTVPPNAYNPYGQPAGGAYQPGFTPPPQKPVYKQWWFWLIIGLALVIIISISAAIATSGSSKGAAPRTTTSAAAETPTDPTDPTTAAPNGTSYRAGMYKVGEDIPAGEYVITVSDSDYSTYIEVTTDSSGELDSIIMNDNFYNRTYVSVKDGQYLNFRDGIAVPVDEAEAYSPAGGLYPSGMYQVGKDIPAGEYKISVEDREYSWGYGYYAVVSDASGTFDAIITNDNIDSDVYQTLKEGQYIILSGTQIQS